jgi:hypothetical protein
MCNCLKSTGDEVTEIRSVTPFHSIIMQNNVDIVIVPDTFYKMTVTCGKHLLDGIKTEIVNEQLVVSNINKCNWLRDFENKYIVEVTMPALDYVELQGSGHLNCKDTLRGDNLLVESRNGTGELNMILNYKSAQFKLHTGPADINAKGNLNECYVYSAGNGYFRGFDLHSEHCTVNTQSTGDVQVDAQKQLGVNIEYNGDVYYIGSPPLVTKTITGKGKLIAL